MQEDILRRLARVEDQQTEVLAEMRALTVSLEDMKAEVHSIVSEIGGAPDPSVRGGRETLRWRLHRIENDQSAAAAAHAALEAFKLARAQTWTTWQKWLLFVFAAVSAVGIVLRIVGIGG